MERKTSRPDDSENFVVSPVSRIGSRMQSAVRLIAIACFGITLAACGGGGGSDGGGGGGGTTGGTGGVTVTVTDEANAALAGANVSATSGTVTQTGATAADGTVTLSGIPAGSASLSVSKDLYDAVSRSVTITRDTTATAAVRLTRKTGTITGTVTDQFSTPIPNATVSAAIDGKTFSGRTAADGKVTLTRVPTGAVAVNVTAAGFKNPAAQNLTVAENATTDFSQTLERLTQVASGLVSSVSVASSVVSNSGQTIQFEVQILVVDEASAAVDSLTAADVTLLPCTVDTTLSGPECIRSSPINDVGYTVTTQDAFVSVPAQPRKPYAAALVMDQSNSIKFSDETDARIFASKVFMEKVGVDDRVVLSAFAASSATQTALIPTPPLAIYGTFTADGPGYFDELNQLSALEGGTTPLYDSLDSMIDFTRTNAPTDIAERLKAVVLFTDGDDTVCPLAEQVACKDNAIQNANASQVDIFTIGLSDQVNFEVLAELADRGNGVFLFAENAEQLIPIYGSLGNLLSRSLATYKIKWTIQADAPNTFVVGRSILGRIQIRSGSSTTNLPIVVRIR